jgi:hypothetical protein
MKGSTSRRSKPPASTTMVMKYTPMPISTSVVVKIISRTASAVCMILVVMRPANSSAVKRHALAQHQAVEVPAQTQREVDGQRLVLDDGLQRNDARAGQQHRLGRPIMGSRSLMDRPDCSMRNLMASTGSGRSRGKCLLSQTWIKASSTSKWSASGVPGSGSLSKKADAVFSAALYPASS